MAASSTACAGRAQAAAAAPSSAAPTVAGLMTPVPATVGPSFDEIIENLTEQTCVLCERPVERRHAMVCCGSAANLCLPHSILARRVTIAAILRGDDCTCGDCHAKVIAPQEIGDLFTVVTV